MLNFINPNRSKRLAVFLLLFTLLLLSLPGSVLELLKIIWPFASDSSSTGDLPVDKIVHAGLFAACTWAVLQGWPRQALLLVAAMGVFAILTECIQLFIPGRSASTLDFLADALGIGLAYSWWKVRGSPSR